MEKIDPNSFTLMNCASQFINIAYRTIYDAGSGILFGKTVLNLTYKQGAVVGSCLGLIPAVAQQAAFVVGIERNLNNRLAIYAVALTTFCAIALYYKSDILTLLERVDTPFTSNNLVEFFFLTLVNHIFAEQASDWFEEQMNAKKANWIVSRLSRGEIKEIIQNIDTQIQKIDLNCPSLNSKITNSLIQRLVGNEPDIRGIVKIPSNSKEVEDLKDLEIKVLFCRCAIIPRRAFDHFIRRLDALGLFICPTTSEAVETMSTPEMKWSLAFYDLIMPMMKKQPKRALEERIKKLQLTGEIEKTDVDHNEVFDCSSLINRYAKARKEKKIRQFIEELREENIQNMNLAQVSYAVYAAHQLTNHEKDRITLLPILLSRMFNLVQEQSASEQDPESDAKQNISGK